jgi:hypothetical protein
MIDSTRLSSRRLASTRRGSRPERGAIAPSSAAGPPSASPSPSFRTEATWDGREAPEQAVDNSAPPAPETEASDPAELPVPEAHPGGSGFGRCRRWGRWLAALAAISGLLVLFALLGDHHHHSAPQPSLAGPKPGLSGVGMPTTLPGDIPVKPLRIAIVLGSGLTRHEQAREIHTVETWLSGHVNPATRLTIVDAVDRLTTPTLTPSTWGSTLPDRSFHGSPVDVLRRKLGNGRGLRVIVTLDHSDPLPGGDAARLHLVSSHGSHLPTAVPLRPGGIVAGAIDPSVARAFANTVAKAVISISNIAEGEEE